MANKTQKPEEQDYNPAHNYGQDEFDKIIDKNFSVGDEHMMEERAKNTGSQDGDLESREEEAAENSGDAFGLQSDLEQQEQTGDTQWQNNTSQETSPSTSLFRLTKKRSAGLGIIITILLATLGLTFTLGPAFGIVNLKEVMVDKFGSRFSSYIEQRNARLMVKKISKDFTTGCTVQIKCRFKGMTSREIKKFEKRNPGTKIVTEGRTLGGKQKIKGIQFYDDTGKQRFVTAANFKESLRKNASLRKTVYNFNKSKVAYWRDLAAGKFFEKFKIYRGKPKTDSEAEKQGKNEAEKEKIRKREIVREFVSGEDYDQFSAGHSSNSDADAAANEQAIRDQVGDNISEEADNLKTDLADNTKAIDPIPSVDGKTVSSATKGITSGGVDAVKGAFLGPIAGPEKACAAKRLIGSVGYLSKLLNTKRLISYSMLFMVTADLIKSGDAEGAYSKHIGDLGSILSSRDPETGYTLSDSFGYQYAAEGKLVSNTKNHKVDTAQIYPYMLGSGLTGTLLAIVNKLDLVPGVKSSCKIIENTFFQIGAGVVTIAADVFTGGSFSIGGALLGAGVGAAFAVAEQIATPMLARAVAGAIITGDEFGMDAGNAITSGFGASVAMNTRGHGAFPLSKTKAVAYDQFSENTQSQIAKDQGNNYFLDPDNSSSFTSKFAFSLAPYFSQPSVDSLSKIFGASISSLQSASRVLAADKGAQYDICTDFDYQTLDVAAGPFCDPQYGLDPNKVDVDEGDTYDADKVIQYMCGSSVDNEDSCAPNAFVDNDGNPQGEYADWISECVESDKPITASGEDETPKECLDPDKTDDPVKYNMFHMYYFDTTIDDQYNDRDAGTGGAGTTTDVNSGSLPSGSARDLAKQIIDSGKVTGDSRYMDQIKNVANGNGNCQVSEKILGLILLLSQNHKLYISSLNRKCTGVTTASGTASLHYADGGGRAVDISMVDDTPMNYSSGKEKDLAKKVFEEAAAVIPKNSELGQINSCGLSGVDVNGIKDIVTDACNHIHIGIPD